MGANYASHRMSYITIIILMLLEISLSQLTTIAGTPPIDITITRHKDVTSNLDVSLAPRSASESLPNPIALDYPLQPTGIFNGTLAIVPIPFDVARQIIPAQFGILQNSYKNLLPGLPAGKYPLLVRMMLDHDIRYGALTNIIPDFQSVHVAFPFVDALMDGYSHFTYQKYLLISSSNKMAIAGAQQYGQVPIQAIFSPQNEAYAFSSNPNDPPRTTFLRASILANGTPRDFNSKFSPLPLVGPWPYSFYKNVTSQPVFQNVTNCHFQPVLYNTTLSTNNYVPVGVKGQLSIEPPLLTKTIFKDVYGIRVGSAFIENGAVPCSDLKGYAGWSV